MKEDPVFRTLSSPEWLALFGHKDGSLGAGDEGIREAFRFVGELPGSSATTTRRLSSLVRGPAPAVSGTLLVLHPALSNAWNPAVALSHLARALGRKLYWWKDETTKWELVTFGAPSGATDWEAVFHRDGRHELLSAS